MPRRIFILTIVGGQGKMTNMTKRKAIVKFVIIGIIVLFGVLSLFNWTVILRIEGRLPYSFNGLVTVIENRAGIDLRGGVLAVFDPADSNPNPTGQELDATVTRLQRMLSDRGHFDTTVTRQGTRQIRIEMPGTDDIDAIFDAIGTPAELSMSLPGAADHEVIRFKTEDIRSVEYRQQSLTEHGTVLNFTSQGGEKFWQLLNDAGQGGTIQIWAGPRTDDERHLISSPTVNEIAPGMRQSTVITSPSRESAQDLKTRIESGLFEVILSPAETSRIPATLGRGAMTAGIIACLVGLLFIFILMIVLYGDMGLLSNLSLIVFVVLFLVALALIEVIQLTLPGIAGIILAIGMAVDANILIFERIKDEFRNGKRMAVAVESGFNKTIRTIIDANITTVIAAVVLYLLGTGPIQGFAITLGLGVAISMVCSLLVTRSFAKTYLYINPNNERRLRLHKLVLKDAVPTETPDAPRKEKSKPKERKLNFGAAKDTSSASERHFGGGK
jgi:protein-export SecD/SecF family membrane protein